MNNLERRGAESSDICSIYDGWLEDTARLPVLPREMMAADLYASIDLRAHWRFLQGK